MKANLPISLVNALEKEVGDTLLDVSLVSGGCIHRAFRLEFQSVQSLFLKYNQVQHQANFEVEALGLETLSKANALPVPEVIMQGATVAHAYLLLKWIEPGSQVSDYWEKFGQRLAQQHQHTASKFGLRYDNYIGSLPQSNQQHDKWGDFFVEQRLKPLVKKAREQGLLDTKDLDQFGRLFSRMNEFFPEEPTALLHGDLWGGNILTGPDGQAVVLDPAIYFGHREMELAFMNLFDRHPARFYDAYDSVWPLAVDWRERLDLCNLYPLLVHLILFGKGYLSGVRQSLKPYI